MKSFVFCVAILALGCVSVADAGIFGRGRGLFRGRWGSRNVSNGAACGTASGAACNGAACRPATNWVQPDAK